MLNDRTEQLRILKMCKGQIKCHRNSVNRLNEPANLVWVEPRKMLTPLSLNLKCELKKQAGNF